MSEPTTIDKAASDREPVRLTFEQGLALFPEDGTMRFGQTLHGGELVSEWAARCLTELAALRAKLAERPPVVSQDDIDAVEKVLAFTEHWLRHRRGPDEHIGWEVGITKVLLGELRVAVAAWSRLEAALAQPAAISRPAAIPTFSPYAYEDDVSIKFCIKGDADYSEQLAPWLIVLRSLETKEIVGAVVSKMVPEAPSEPTIQPAIRDMCDILCDDKATDDDKRMALNTLREAIEPSPAIDLEKGWPEPPNGLKELAEKAGQHFTEDVIRPYLPTKAEIDALAEHEFLLNDDGSPRVVQPSEKTYTANEYRERFGRAEPEKISDDPEESGSQIARKAMEAMEQPDAAQLPSVIANQKSMERRGKVVALEQQLAAVTAERDEWCRRCDARCSELRAVTAEREASRPVVAKAAELRDECDRLVKEKEQVVERLLKMEAFVASLKEAYQLADEERLKETNEAHDEANKWKAEGDMHGWNFHEGKANGTTTASIIFYRVFRMFDDGTAGRDLLDELADLRKRAVTKEPRSVGKCLICKLDIWSDDMQSDPGDGTIAHVMCEVTAERNKALAELAEVKAKLAGLEAQLPADGEVKPTDETPPGYRARVRRCDKLSWVAIAGTPKRQGVLCELSILPEMFLEQWARRMEAEAKQPKPVPWPLVSREELTNLFRGFYKSSPDWNVFAAAVDAWLRGKLEQAGVQFTELAYKSIDTNAH